MTKQIKIKKVNLQIKNIISHLFYYQFAIEFQLNC